MSVIEFKKYPSMENSSKEKIIDYLRMNGFTDGLWQVH